VQVLKETEMTKEDLIKAMANVSLDEEIMVSVEFKIREGHTTLESIDYVGGQFINITIKACPHCDDPDCHWLLHG